MSLFDLQKKDADVANHGRHLITYAKPNDPKLRRFIIKSIERLSGQRPLAHVYSRAAAHGPQAFFGKALDELSISTNITQQQLEKIPKTGPVVFVANHPFGVVDGLVLCDIAMRSRGDFKVLIHRALFKEKSLESYMLPIDFSNTREAAKSNIAVKNEAIRYLKAGGTMVIFPAGGISTAKHAFGPVTDLEWKLLPAKLIHMAKATVVPVFFHGTNSQLFHLVSQVSMTLRLSLVVREVYNKRGQPVQTVVGDPINYSELAHIKGKRELMEELRTIVYNLGA